MTINERIIQAVTPVVPVCVPDRYDPNQGEASATYCTFNYTEIPDSFGDDAPEDIRYLIQLHFHAPLDAASGASNNTMAVRKALRQAVFAAGFTYPTVQNASDDSGQHYVLEFEGLDGEV